MSKVVTLADLSEQISILAKAVLLNKETLTIEEAAVYTGLSVSFIYKLTCQRQIPFFKPRGKLLYFSRSELDSWLKQNRVKTTDEIEQQAAGRYQASESL